MFSLLDDTSLLGLRMAEKPFKLQSMVRLKCSTNEMCWFVFHHWSGTIGMNNNLTICLPSDHGWLRDVHPTRCTSPQPASTSFHLASACSTCPLNREGCTCHRARLQRLGRSKKRITGLFMSRSISTFWPVRDNEESEFALRYSYSR